MGDMVQTQKVKVQNYMYHIKDPEALNPKNTGGKGSGLAKIYQVVRKLKKAGLFVDVSCPCANNDLPDICCFDSFFCINPE